MQHAGREQDEDPGVDDGVDGDEDEGDQVQPVGLNVPPDGVDVHPDLERWGEQRDEWISLVNPPANAIMMDVLGGWAGGCPSAAAVTNQDSTGRSAPGCSTLFFDNIG